MDINIQQELNNINSILSFSNQEKKDLQSKTNMYINTQINNINSNKEQQLFSRINNILDKICLDIQSEFNIDKSSLDSIVNQHKFTISGGWKNADGTSNTTNVPSTSNSLRLGNKFIGKIEKYIPADSSITDSPPTITFTSEMYHPNIYPNGKVCISILHDGVDEYGYESIQERWNPTHSISSILISIISMIGEPNFESPANVDASKLWQDNYNEYKKIIYKIVAKSLNE